MNPPILLQDLLRELYRYRKLIILVCITTAILTAVISLFQPDYYQASTTFYAASDDLRKPEMIFGLTSYPMEYYGGDDELDRLMAVGNSSEFVQRMIVQFKLYEHYKIDTTGKQAKLKAEKRWRKNYSLQKNKLDALELSVEDIDPQLSAEMTNYGRKALEEMSANLIQNSQQILLNNYQKDIESAEKGLDVIAIELENVRKKFGIYDIDAQTEVVAKEFALMDIRIAGAESRYELISTTSLASAKAKKDSLFKISLELQSLHARKESLISTDSTAGFNLTRLNEGGASVLSLQSLFRDTKNRLIQDKLRFEQIRAAYDSDNPSVILVEEAVVPEKKARPRRSIIVFAATMAAFILMVFFVLLYSSLRKTDWGFLHE